MSSAPPPFNIPAIIATSAITAANTATIASQAFKRGGFPMGKNAKITVNEQGQEAVLNARATSALGTDRINRLNAGVNTDNSVTNEIHYSPTITVGTDTNKNFIDLLKKDKEAFADFIENDLIGRGFLNLSK